MTFWQRKELAQHLRAIPLETVLPLCGAQKDHDDKRKWHTSAGALSVTGAKFMNWHNSVGGGGAIDLVMHLNHLDFKAAVDWLAHHFPGARPPQSVPPTPPSELRLPPPDPSKLGRVKEYLAHQRGITPTLLDRLTENSHVINMKGCVSLRPKISPEP